MPGRYRHWILAIFFACRVSAGASAASPSVPIAWSTEWGPAVFAQAAREHRFVLLDLHAVWCHWCHVMDEETYTDARVRSLIGKRYLAVSVDADSDPGLTSRYGEWGWPATIVLAPDGTELVKRRGFIPAPQMASLLKAIIDDPTPGPSVARATLAAATGPGRLGRHALEALMGSYVGLYDEEHAGWGTIHKFIDAPAMELAFELADAGDAKATERARRTLDANLNLVDPVWGGVYQYSDALDWHSPHFEKLLEFQADDLRLYSEAYARWGDPAYLTAAESIRRYLAEFLTSPDGAFYVSQDADLSVEHPGKDYYTLDDRARRALGVPRVDTHVYARESGWAIRALSRFHDVTGDAVALRDAIRAAEWVLAHRALEGGGFRHDEADRGGPFLDDSISMAEAFVALYRSTGERRWLTEAESALRFVARRLRDPAAGFIASPVPTGARGVFRDPVRAIDQNVAVARLANLLYRYTGEKPFRQSALHAVKLLARTSPESGQLHADVLLADRELAAAPTHVTIVGAKSDPAARALHAAALRVPATYLQVDWWDRAEGPLPNPAIQYPVLAVAAAFACSENACSTPVYEPAKVVTAVLASRDAD